MQQIWGTFPRSRDSEAHRLRNQSVADHKILTTPPSLIKLQWRQTWLLQKLETPRSFHVTFANPSSSDKTTRDGTSFFMKAPSCFVAPFATRDSPGCALQPVSPPSRTMTNAPGLDRDTLTRHQLLHDSEPPSHLSTKPTRKARGEKACTSCRLSKQRCDGSDPCSRCLQKNKSCQYLARRSRQVWPTDPTLQRFQTLQWLTQCCSSLLDGRRT